MCHPSQTPALRPPLSRLRLRPTLSRSRSRRSRTPMMTTTTTTTMMTSATMTGSMTTMTEAPERIWIEDEFGEGDDDQWTYGTWDVRNYMGYDVEYVRADILQALTAERDRLREALRGLERASTEVASYGARTGPQWIKLTVANLSARVALKGESQ